MTKDTNKSASATPPLDDIMIAMDVVDTLRHDKRIVDRELNDEKRRAELIRRLKEIYGGQGIEVSDEILEEGVQALEDERFTYTPPKDGLMTRLAKVYVTRNEWGKYVIGGLLGFLVLWFTWQLFYERPRSRQAEETRIELAERLPKTLRTLVMDIEAEARDGDIKVKARQVSESGLRAAKSGRLDDARSAKQNLNQMLRKLRQEYDIKIVVRRGERSGLWRIPKINPNARNYYLVVEAVNAAGKILPQSIINQETGKREQVKIWAIRVPKTVYDAVRADKSDDGIIQNAVVAEKMKGYLKPKWRIQTSGGAITKW